MITKKKLKMMLPHLKPVFIELSQERARLLITGGIISVQQEGSDQRLLVDAPLYQILLAQGWITQPHIVGDPDCGEMECTLTPLGREKAREIADQDDAHYYQSGLPIEGERATVQPTLFSSV